MAQKDQDSGLTQNQLINLTGANVNQISYLRDMRILPVLKPSAGPGFPIIYSKEAVKVVEEHLRKHNGPITEHED